MSENRSKLETFAECVSGILIDDSRVLVERRRANDDSDPGVIVLPGGHVNKGESLEQALRREMREELGIQVEKMKFAFTRTYTASNGEKQRIHYFHIEEWKGKIESREAESVSWESSVNNLDDGLERKIVRRVLSQSK
jgi:mutator protein MutT